MILANIIVITILGFINMPIYEYQCQLCGYKFEQLQSLSEKPLRVCPQCKKAKLVKLVSNTSFQLKGTGWYVTDFKNQTKKDAGSSPKRAPVKKEPEVIKADTKTEGKK